MKITIDLADTQFQATVAEAVKNKIHALAADELEKQMKEAVETVAGTLDKRFEAVIKGIVTEAMGLKGWQSQETLRSRTERQINVMIRGIVVEQFAAIFPAAVAAKAE
jgi:hypothetical protein